MVMNGIECAPSDPRSRSAALVRGDFEVMSTLIGTTPLRFRRSVIFFERYTTASFVLQVSHQSAVKSSITGRPSRW